ncbi:MAG: hypothetical protein AB8B69_16855 [Chitinophagales bacterium]
MKNDNTLLFFEEDGHLSAKGRMFYAEAIEFDKKNLLPDQMYEHVNFCAECSFEIIMLKTLMDEISIGTVEEHPVFSSSNSRYSLSDKLEGIDDLLEKIKAEAILIPLYENIIEEQLASAYRLSSSPIKVLSPISEQLYQDKVTFTFEQATSIKLILQIENHQGEVYKAEIPTNTTTHTLPLLPPMKFPTGLYYWKLVGRGVQRMMGKFYVYQV